MEPTLEASIARLFGGQPPPGSSGADTARAETPAAGPPGAQSAAAAIALQELTSEARAHYDRAIAAQRSGDWAKYGEEIKALGEVLQRMNR
jgi:hypothetical protein